MYHKKPHILVRLVEDLDALDQLILHQSKKPINGTRSGSFESKPPTSVPLLNFKMKMEAELRRTCRKIERKLGY